ncbi:retrovirus-related pol polyprotein from transposon TNT 1-94 [Tanacetum coccineum]
MAGDEPKKGVTDDASSSQQRKLISPFDITTLDNPGLVITQVQLKGDNYDEWSRSFRTTIRARKKFGFIDGTIERPGEKDKDIEDSWTINSLLVSWIRNTIEPSLCSTISHVEIAKSSVGRINNIFFFVTNGPRIQQLKSDLAGWKCVCNLGAVFEKKQEEEKVHTFLMSLDESVYGTARSNILAQDPLPNLNKGDRPRVDTKRNGAGRGLSSGRGKGRGGRGTTRANTVQIGSTSANNGIKDADSIPLPGLTSKQWETLLQMLNGSGLETMNGKFSWIIDSGASHHMTGLIEKLTNIKEIVEWPVELPDGHVVMANKEGNILFNNGFILCYTLRTVIGAGKRWDGGLFYFREKPLVQALNTTSSISVDLWHKRLGHPSLEVINFLPGVSSSRKDRVISENCEVCHRAKQCREKFPVSDNKVNSISELIHFDLWGPYRTISYCHASYFLIIVDDLSRSVWVYLLVNKSDVSHTIKMFLAMVEKQFNKQVKIIRSDNGTEFVCMKQFFLDHGIVFQTSCVGTPQQNGRVEQKHRHSLNVARALRFQSSLPIDLWGECVLIALLLRF